MVRRIHKPNSLGLKHRCKVQRSISGRSDKERMRFSCFTDTFSMRNGRWQIIDQLLVAFPDTGWVDLALEVTPGGIQPTVNGATQRRIAVPDPVDGMVGVLKFYDNVVGFRRFRAEGVR